MLKGIGSICKESPSRRVKRRCNKEPGTKSSFEAPNDVSEEFLGFWGPLSGLARLVPKDQALESSVLRL